MGTSSDIDAKKRRPSVWRILLGVVGFFVVSFVLLAGWVFYKMSEAPGEGPRAERAKEVGMLAVAALETWRQQHGEYPDNLGELAATPPMTPALLKEIDDKQDVQFEYRSFGTRYELGFGYTGPGRNNCDYAPGAPTSWHCSGYY